MVQNDEKDFGNHSCVLMSLKKIKGSGLNELHEKSTGGVPVSAEHFDRRLCRQEEVLTFFEGSHLLESL